MKRHLLIVGLMALASCGLMRAKVPESGMPESGVAESGVTESGMVVAAAPAPLVVAGQSAASFDATTSAEQAAALAPKVAASEVDLGLMVVALGSPAEPGFWLSAGSVSAPGKGRVVTDGGATVAVDLRAGTGGALLSLAAFRALGLGLTDLPEVRVLAD